jgi:haloalkane dehalogenase
VDEGSGKVIVLLHGNPTWSFLYRHIIEDLKGEFRVIAPDYPGFGLSYAANGYDFKASTQAKSMNEFIDKLGLDSFSIMIQDWGGPIGLDIAEHHQEQIDGLIIGNTWAWPLERVGHKAFSTLFGGYVGQFLAWSGNGVSKFFMYKGVEKSLNDKVLAMYYAPFEKTEDRKQTHIFPAELWDADVFLSKVYARLPALSKKPVLIVWGEDDFAFQGPERERFEEIFENSKTLLLKDAGHFIQEDAPHEISAAIKAWYHDR